MPLPLFLPKLACLVGYRSKSVSPVFLRHRLRRPHPPAPPLAPPRHRSLLDVRKTLRAAWYKGNPLRFLDFFFPKSSKATEPRRHHTAPRTSHTHTTQPGAGPETNPRRRPHHHPEPNHTQKQRQKPNNRPHGQAGPRRHCVFTARPPRPCPFPPSFFPCHPPAPTRPPTEAAPSP